MGLCTIIIIFIFICIVIAFVLYRSTILRVSEFFENNCKQKSDHGLVLSAQEAVNNVKLLKAVFGRNVMEVKCVQNCLNHLIINLPRMSVGLHKITLSGSASELFIETPLSCFGDLDVTCRWNDYHDLLQKQCIALGEGTVLEKLTYLDPSVHVCLDRVGQLYEILEQIMTEYKAKTFWKYLSQADDLKMRQKLFLKRCGPAISVSLEGSAGTKKKGKVDFVEAIDCPKWLPTAHGWYSRKRKHGWPTTELKNKVLEGGCDLVPTAAFSQDSFPLFELIKLVIEDDFNFDPKVLRQLDIYKWRISFSKAEFILARSWSVKQQIVYHMLRYFAKKELFFQKWNGSNEFLCSYNIKTAMLWTCEFMPSTWWDSSDVISICTNVLANLLTWMNKGFCPHYFISNHNLFKAHMDQMSPLTLPTILNINFSQAVHECLSTDLQKSYHTTLNKLKSFSKQITLAEWFDNKYKKKVESKPMRL